MVYKISDKLQYGGTSLIPLNKLASRHLDTGAEETKLERWYIK